MIHGRFMSEEKGQIIIEDIFRRVSYDPHLLYPYREDKDILIQAIVYEGAEDQSPAAAGCMLLKPEEARIAYIAVLPEFRGRSYGEFLLRMLIDKAKTSGLQRIVLSCDYQMTEYFQKFGFMVDGKDSELNGIVYRNMLYKEIGGKCCHKSI